MDRPVFGNPLNCCSGGLTCLFSDRWFRGAEVSACGTAQAPPFLEFTEWDDWRALEQLLAWPWCQSTLRFVRVNGHQMLTAAGERMAMVIVLQCHAVDGLAMRPAETGTRGPSFLQERRCFWELECSSLESLLPRRRAVEYRRLSSPNIIPTRPVIC